MGCAAQPWLGLSSVSSATALESGKGSDATAELQRGGVCTVQRLISAAGLINNGPCCCQGSSSGCKCLAALPREAVCPTSHGRAWAAQQRAVILFARIPPSEARQRESAIAFLSGLKIKPFSKTRGSSCRMQGSEKLPVRSLGCNARRRLIREAVIKALPLFQACIYQAPLAPGTVSPVFCISVEWKKKKKGGIQPLIVKF